MMTLLIGAEYYTMPRSESRRDNIYDECEDYATIKDIDVITLDTSDQKKVASIYLVDQTDGEDENGYMIASKSINATTNNDGK